MLEQTRPLSAPRDGHQSQVPVARGSPTNLIRLINQSFTVCSRRGHDHAQRHARRILAVMVPTERDIPTPQALMDVLLPRGGFAKLLPRKIGIAAVDTNGAAIDARAA